MCSGLVLLFISFFCIQDVAFAACSIVGGGKTGHLRIYTQLYKMHFAQSTKFLYFINL